MRTLIERKAANFMKDPFTLKKEKRGLSFANFLFFFRCISRVHNGSRANKNLSPSRFLISSLRETFHIKGIT